MVVETLLNSKRLQFLLWQLSLTEHIPGAILEAGVYKGGSLYEIALATRSWGKQIYGYDTFTGLPESEETSDALDKGRFGDTTYDGVCAIFRPFDNVSIYQGLFPESFKRRALSFAHLDMDLGGPTFHALQAIKSFMSAGGIIVLDDYGFPLTPGIKPAVSLFLSLTSKFEIVANSDYQIALQRKVD